MTSRVLIPSVRALHSTTGSTDPAGSARLHSAAIELLSRAAHVVHLRGPSVLLRVPAEEVVLELELGFDRTTGAPDLDVTALRHGAQLGLLSLCFLPEQELTRAERASLLDAAWTAGPANLVPFALCCARSLATDDARRWLRYATLAVIELRTPALFEALTRCRPVRLASSPSIAMRGGPPVLTQVPGAGAARPATPAARSSTTATAARAGVTPASLVAHPARMV